MGLRRDSARSNLGSERAFAEFAKSESSLTTAIASDTMLDCFEILTTSGVVLWSKHYAPVGVNIINSLIKDVFIGENAPRNSTSFNDASAAQNPPYKKDKYTLKWTTAKDLGLIFVVGNFARARVQLKAKINSLRRPSTSR